MGGQSSGSAASFNADGSPTFNLGGGGESLPLLVLAVVAVIALIFIIKK